MKDTFSCGLDVHNRNCWVIGQDEEAVYKSLKLAKAGARVTLVTPGLEPSLDAQVQHPNITQLKQEFDVSQLSDQFFVVFCDKANVRLAQEIRRVCQEKRILLCAVDLPDLCDVVNVATFQRGRLKVSISTGGAAPAVARKIRQGLEASLKDEPLEDFFEYLAALRLRLEKEVPDKEERRKKLIQAACDVEFKAQIKLPHDWSREENKN